MPVHAAPVGARLFRWLGALLFLCSLGYFLLSYMTTYGAPTTGGAASVAVVWNVTIFTLFALHHSVCARKPVRLWIARLVPASLERSTYIWIASLLLIAVGGVWLGLRSAAILDVWELTGLADAGNVRPPSAQDNSSRVLAGTQPPAVEFTTTGPYGWIRHPIYASWFLIVFAVVPMTVTRLTFAVVSCAYVLIAIPFEERSMRAGARHAHRRYEGQVRWRLIPWLY